MAVAQLNVCSNTAREHLPYLRDPKARVAAHVAGVPAARSVEQSKFLLRRRARDEKGVEGVRQGWVSSNTMHESC